MTTRDPRPTCIACGYPWAPPEGVDATSVRCLRCLRVDSGLLLRELAHRIGCQPSVLSDAEHGRGCLSVEDWAKAMRVFGEGILSGAVTAKPETGGKLSAERLAEIRTLRLADFGQAMVVALLGHLAALEARNRKLVSEIRVAVGDCHCDVCDNVRAAIEENDDGK